MAIGSAAIAPAAAPALLAVVSVTAMQALLSDVADGHA
jgi:hypothetical protein